MEKLSRTQINYIGEMISSRVYLKEQRLNDSIRKLSPISASCSEAFIVNILLVRGLIDASREIYNR